MEEPFQKNRQYLQFCLYGFLKNLRFYDAFLLLFFLENGLSFSQIGILYAAREIITNIMEIPSGIIADVYGRKKSLAGAFGIYILSFIVFYFSTSFYLLLIGMLLTGAADAFRSGTHKGMIMDYLSMNNWRAQKVAYYGHTRSWSQIGSAFSALVAGTMVFYAGSYRVIYLFTTIPYLLNFINIYTYPDALNFPIRKGNKKKSVKDTSLNLLATVRKRQVFEVVNSTALHSSFLKAIKDYIQPLLVSIALLLPFLSTMDLTRKSGLVIGVSYFILFLLSSQASRHASKVLSLKIKNIQIKTLTAGLLTGVVCGLWIYYELWLPALLLFVLIYIIENLRKPILTGMLADSVDPEILTSVISVQSFYQTLVTSALAIGIGIVADTYGIGLALFSISLVLALGNLLVYRKSK